MPKELAANIKEFDKQRYYYDDEQNSEYDEDHKFVYESKDDKHNWLASVGAFGLTIKRQSLTDATDIVKATFFTKAEILETLSGLEYEEDECLVFTYSEKMKNDPRVAPRVEGYASLQVHAFLKDDKYFAIAKANQTNWHQTNQYFNHKFEKEVEIQLSDYFTKNEIRFVCDPYEDQTLGKTL